VKIFFEKYKKAIYIFIAFLFAINVFVWQEVFVLCNNKNLKVSYLNVGQGDSAFIITPQNHQILIDGGPDSTVVSKIAKQIPFWDKSLDLVILSHPEKDHMSGLIEVLKRYKVDYILWSGVKMNSPEYLELLKVLVKQKNLGAKIITAEFGQKIKVGDLIIDILNPQENLFGQDFSKSANETSVVAKLDYGKNSFLFVGDIGFETEEKLVAINRYCKEVVTDEAISTAGIATSSSAGSAHNDGGCVNLHSAVLKVAHHGSKYSTSEEFLQSVKPNIAIISVGKNSYGHPTPEVISRLDNTGTKIFRTDQQGDIIIESNGQNLFLSK